MKSADRTSDTHPLSQINHQKINRGIPADDPAPLLRNNNNSNNEVDASDASDASDDDALNVANSAVRQWNNNRNDEIRSSRQLQSANIQSQMADELFTAIIDHLNGCPSTVKAKVIARLRLIRLPGEAADSTDDQPKVIIL